MRAWQAGWVGVLSFTIPVFAVAEPVDFVEEIKPLLEGACVRCHGDQDEEKNGGFRLDRKELAFKGGEGYGPEVIKPGDPNDSPLYWMTTVHLDNRNDPESMPPRRPLNEQQQDLLKRWIAEGANWPDGVVLRDTERVTFAEVGRMLTEGGPFTKAQMKTLRLWVEQGADWDRGRELGADDVLWDDIYLVRKIRERLVAESNVKRESDMKDYRGVIAARDVPYDRSIPAADWPYDMVAIPSGEFLMGSPPDESHREEDEGPQRKVKVAAFWMGKYEITWNQFEPFMITDVARNPDGSREKLPKEPALVDYISSPTVPYIEMDFGMGKDGYPAINMTQHAASKFCQWLSVQTGHFYRLPTEAEWEYACRAGTTTAYHFGDDPEKLAEYAWFWGPDGRDRYAKVGLKKPNPWGLHDMHGNVLEWCLDQYFPDAYQTGRKTIPAEKLYPRVFRGGSWYDDPGLLRSAARSFSSGDLKGQDPMLPKSLWHHTDASWLGFRIVRPLEIPPAEEMEALWNSGRIFEDGKNP